MSILDEYAWSHIRIEFFIDMKLNQEGKTIPFAKSFVFEWTSCFCYELREELAQLLPSRARRRLSRGLKRKHLSFLNRLRKAKKEAALHEKPATIKTHLRDMIVLPEMVGSMVGVYNGKVFNQVVFQLYEPIFAHFLSWMANVWKSLRHFSHLFVRYIIPVSQSVQQILTSCG